jgi:hypothetical protein
MEKFEPTKEHQWLGRLIGDWSWSHDVPATGDTRVTHLEGTETYRAIGSLWVQGEAVGPLPDGGVSVALTTLGWDPSKGRFTGTWVGSPMPHLWVYDGELDASGRALALYAEGPAMDGSGTHVPYKDVIEFTDDNARTLTGHTRGADGIWKAFMTVQYRRR